MNKPDIALVMADEPMLVAVLCLCIAILALVVATMSMMVAAWALHKPGRWWEEPDERPRN